MLADRLTKECSSASKPANARQATPQTNIATPSSVRRANVFSMRHAAPHRTPIVSRTPTATTTPMRTDYCLNWPGMVQLPIGSSALLPKRGERNRTRLDDLRPVPVFEILAVRSNRSKVDEDHHQRSHRSVDRGGLGIVREHFRDQAACRVGVESRVIDEPMNCVRQTRWCGVGGEPTRLMVYVGKHAKCVDYV